MPFTSGSLEPVETGAPPVPTAPPLLTGPEPPLLIEPPVALPPLSPLRPAMPELPPVALELGSPALPPFAGVAALVPPTPVELMPLAAETAAPLAPPSWVGAAAPTASLLPQPSRATAHEDQHNTWHERAIRISNFQFPTSLISAEFPWPPRAPELGHGRRQ